jgi:hypothetical protein
MTDPADPPEPDPDRDDADLIAYLDGELSGPDAREVEAKVDSDPTVRAKAEAYRKTFDLLDYLPKTEPAPNFAARTLTRLQATPAEASGPARSEGRGRWPAAWAAGCIIALLAGYLAHAGYRSATDGADDLALSDLRVIERLQLYLGVDDLDFSRRLDAPDLFAPDPDTPPPAAPPPDPPAGRRDKLIAEFRRFPPARQQQLRTLDQQLAELPAAERDRLFAVLEGYAVWLDRLADPDRRELLTSADPAARLDAIRRVRERLWRESLPIPLRDQLKLAADADERLRLVDRWKKAEATRRTEWALARRQWGELARDPTAKLWPFSDPALAAQVDEFVRNVLKADLGAKIDPKTEMPPACRLSREEWVELKLRAEAAQRDGYWLLYGASLRRLAERHPGLPEPAGRPPITDLNDLPAEVRDLKKQKVVQEVRKAHVQGKWPDFALEVVQAAQRAGVPVGVPLGPCRPGEFKPAVEQFLANGLGPVLLPAERDGLKALEGKWPDYPRRMVELSRQHDLSVPGVTLPGPPSLWGKYYSLGAP